MNRKRLGLSVLAVVLFFVVLVTASASAPKVFEPKTKDLLDYSLLENNPVYTMAIESITPNKPENLVEFSIALGGFGPVVSKIGEPVSLNLGLYDFCQLYLVNRSPDDWFEVNFYVKTGPSYDCYESVWISLAPGQDTYVVLDLSGVANIQDVREMGFGVRCVIGQGQGLADHIDVAGRGSGHLGV